LDRTSNQEGGWLRTQSNVGASPVRRAAFLLLFGALPLSVPPLLLLALVAGMAESGGKEPNIALALLLIAFVCAAEAGSMLALKKVYDKSRWKRAALVALLTLLAFVFWIVLRGPFGQISDRH